MPHANLLNHLIKTHGLKNDAELAKRIGIDPSKLCNIRAERVPVGPVIMVRISEEFDMPTKEIKKFLQEYKFATYTSLKATSDDPSRPGRSAYLGFE